MTAGNKHGQETLLQGLIRQKDAFNLGIHFRIKSWIKEKSFKNVLDFIFKEAKKSPDQQILVLQNI